MSKQLYLFVIVLFGANHQISASYTRTLECGEDEVKILSPWMYEENGPPCYEFITSYPNLKNEAFRKECQRWYGLSELPYTVANYQVFYCRRYPNGTTQYRADICCKGHVLTNHCFACKDSVSDYDCAYRNPPEACGVDQVCMTTVNFRKKYPFTERMKDNGCADKTTCEAMAFTNDMLCKSWIPNPKCVYCCDSPFCNLETPSPMHHAIDNPCLSDPCINGGTCLLDLTSQTGYKCICGSNFQGDFCQYRKLGDYRQHIPLQQYPCDARPCKHGGMCINQGAGFKCICKQGFTGLDCSIDYPECGKDKDGYCLNGGTCIEHSVFGDRCRCQPGYIGTRCESEVIQCKYASSLWRSSYSMFLDFGDDDCTEMLDAHLALPLDDPLKLKQCRTRMRQPGRPEFQDSIDGEVKELEARFLWKCAKGEKYGEYSDMICCPSCYSMPCQNGGWCIQQADGDYVCKCRFGWEGRNCDIKTGLCLVTGDPHYITFDGTVITTQTLCRLIVSITTDQVKDEMPEASFYVYVQNERRGNPENVKASYPNLVIFGIGGTEFVISGDLTVKANDVVVGAGSVITGTKISYNGRFLRLERSQVIIEFDGLWTLVIKLGSYYKNKVTGLCGNYDGDPIYSELYKRGTNTQSKQQKSVIKSWYIYYPGASTKCRPRKKRDVSDDNDLIDDDDDDDDGEDMTPICNITIKSLIRGDRFCGQIINERSIFRQCIEDELSNPEQTYEACVYDACVTSNDVKAMKDVVCAALEAFALQCQDLGHYLDWRPITKCEMTCPDGMLYKKKASACRPTCRDPDAAKLCHLPDKETCVCPDGLLFHDNQCIEPHQCGCIDENGNRHELRTTWTTRDCTVAYRCELCTTCVYPVGTIRQSTITCKPYQKCQYNETTSIGSCVLDYTCPSGQIFSDSRSGCPATCNDPDAPARCNIPSSYGCVCPEGKLRHNNTCIDPEECKCSGSEGIPVPIGTTWLSSDCSTNYSCETCNYCSLPVAILKEREHACSKDEICVILLSGLGQCQPEPDCPPGMEYAANISSCPPSCQHPLDNESCEVTLSSSCVCSKGLLLQGDICVEPEKCGCFTEDGRNLKTGVTWLSADCRQWFQCRQCEHNCTSLRPYIVQRDHVCNDHEMCVALDDNTGICQQVPECSNGLVYSLTASDCPATCTDPDAPLDCSTAPGCTCPEGLVLNEGRCIEPGECQCEMPNGRHLQIGESGLDVLCSVKWTCKPCYSCLLPVGELVQEEYTCPETEICIAYRNGTGSCEPVPRCPDFEVYSINASACPRTCADPDAPERCSQSPRRGCVCVDTLVRKNGSCVDAKQCGCVDSQGNEMQIGSTWLSPGCQTQYTCEKCTTCSLPVGVLKQTAYNCSAGEICEQETAYTGKCVPAPKCPPGMVYNLSAPACAATCHDPNAPIRCQRPETGGCSCPYGFLLDDNNCVAPHQCKCRTASGKQVMIGTKWLSPSCTVLYSCVACDHCAWPVAVSVEMPHSCPDDLRCVVDSENIGYCKPACSHNMVFSFNASACPPSCSDPVAPDRCERRAGCTCPRGQVLDDDGTCIDSLQCGCLDGKGDKIQVGDSWLSADCSSHYSCVPCDNCTSKTPELIEHSYSCPADEICLPAGKDKGRCSKAPTCPLGKVFRVDASACAATCREPDAPHNCSTSARPGCVCPEGMLDRDGECVYPEQCQCIDENNHSFEIGTTWWSANCTTQYKCVLCTSCNLPVGQIIIHGRFCPDDHICVQEDGYSICKPTPPCPDTMIFSRRASSCQKTCQHPDAADAAGDDGKLCAVTEGCTCPERLLKDGNKCVQPAECTCTQGNRHFKSGDSWLSADCTIKYTCTPCDNCTVPVPLITYRQHQCAVCTAIDKHIGKCERVSRCPRDMVYRHNVTSCPATCQDPDAPLHCPLANKDECVCLPGLVLRAGECVTPDKCKCIDEEGNTFEIGTSWLSNDCSISYECHTCKRCSLPVAMISDRHHQCASNTVCIIQNTTGVCEPVLQCPVNMEYVMDTTACPATCLDPEAYRKCTKPRTKGCRCKPGLVLRDAESDVCIKPRECQCLFGGIKFQIQSTWLSSDCSRQFICKPCTQCLLPVAQTVSRDHQCEDGYSCQRDERGIGRCLPHPACPPTMVYSDTATSCLPTCTDPEAPDNCGEVPRPGCTCPGHLVYRDGRCVEPRKCRCLDQYGRSYQVGDTWLSSDCKVFYSCDSCRSCRLPVSVITNRRHQCELGERCVSFDRKYGACKKVQPCPKDMTYSFKKSACPATCRDPEAPQHCHLADTEGCQCEEGLLLKDDRCVTPSMCGCLYQRSREFEIGLTWLSTDCSRQYECKACKTCQKPIGIIKETPFTCRSNEKCVLDSRGSGICVQKDPESLMIEEEASLTNQISYQEEPRSNEPTLTLNGIVIVPNDVIDVRPSVQYTLGITLRHSSSTTKILMRKVVGYSVTQYEQCLGARTCRDVYEFERRHEWQRVRLEIEVLDAGSSNELVLICNIKDPTEDENWKIKTRSVSALISSSSKLFTIKLSHFILALFTSYVVSILLL